MVQAALGVPSKDLARVSVEFLGLWCVTKRLALTGRETIGPICKGGPPPLPLLSSIDIAQYIRHALAISEHENQGYDPFVKPKTKTAPFEEFGDGMTQLKMEVWFIALGTTCKSEFYLALTSLKYRRFGAYGETSTLKYSTSLDAFRSSARHTLL